MSCFYHTETTCPGRSRSFEERDLYGQDYGNEVETTYEAEWWTLVTCPTDYCNIHDNKSDAHIDSVVIAVDGACRNNGRADAEASAGIFFHRDNHQWNEAIVLSDEFRTNQQAELFAGLKALQIAGRLRELNPSRSGRNVYRRKGPMRRLRRVVIKSDSSYLVNAMTDWINKWKQNGFRNCRGLPVTNAGLFRQIDEEIETLNGMDVEVQFWHVLRGQNEMADCLANAALDGVEAPEALRRFSSTTVETDSYSSEDW